MVPAFGAHVVLAVIAAFALRGARTAAVAACLFIGNPLTHAATVPLSYAIGRALLPNPPLPREDWLPAWMLAALPVAEEALAGGAVLGLVVAPVVFAAVRVALRGKGRL